MAEEVINPESAGSSPEAKPAEAPGGLVVPEAAPALERETKTEQAESRYSEILSKVLPGKAPSHQEDGQKKDIHTDAEILSKATDTATRVELLVGMAQVKGVHHAVSVARKLNDYYVLDMMHDELADKFHEELLKRGLINKE